MIDFHTHIIPNVDDGSTSVEETFSLMDEAEKAGFKGIISTSHYIDGYYESDVDLREQWIEAISQGLEKQNIDLKLYLGNECYYSEQLIDQLNEYKVTTLNNSKYLLFEFPMNSKPSNIEDFVFNLIGKDYIPVLAHPERYSFVQSDPSLVSKLIKQGVLMQANYASILGFYGERPKLIVKKLLESNAIHFLGSDVHRKETIYPKIPRAIEEIKKIIGEEKFNELSTKNPELVLNDDYIEYEENVTIKLSLIEKMKLK